MPNYQKWDIKYYYKIHCARQKALGNTPVCYAAFSKRLKKMNLHDAIYMPRVEYNVRDQSPKTPIQDTVRRRQTLKDENVMAADFYSLRKVEKMNTIKMPKPKKTLIQKIIWWIKKK